MPKKNNPKVVTGELYTKTIEVKKGVADDPHYKKYRDELGKLKFVTEKVVKDNKDFRVIEFTIEQPTREKTTSLRKSLKSIVDNKLATPKRAHFKRAKTNQPAPVKKTTSKKKATKKATKKVTKKKATSA